MIDGSEALELLLYTLNTRFKINGVDPDVRIFGHSKGSHVVSLVSEQDDFANMDFYAFAYSLQTVLLG